MNKANNLSLRYITVGEEDGQGISMTDMTETIQTDIDWIAKIRQFCSMAEYSADKLTHLELEHFLFYRT